MFETIRRALMCIGAQVPMHASPLWMRVVTDLTWEEASVMIAEYIGSVEPEDLVLLEDVEDMGKYERFVPEGLRAREFAAHRLDAGRLRS